MTIPKAIDFHNQLTVEGKQARLQYLRNYWVTRVRQIEGIEILTPDDPARYGATTSFRLKGMRTGQEGARFTSREYRILTVARKKIAKGSVVRVTPALYSTTAELDRLVAALKQESAVLT